MKREWEINHRPSRLDKNDFLAGHLVADRSGWWPQTALISGSALTHPVGQSSGRLSLSSWGELRRTKRAGRAGVPGVGKKGPITVCPGVGAET